MKAYLLEAQNRFGWGEVPRWEGDDLVRVAPTYVGLCGSDVHIVRGHRRELRLPVAIGHEIVGVALDGEHAGKSVAIDPVEGCRSCARCADGHEQLCSELRIVGVGRNGGLAEEVAVSPRQVHLVPEGVSNRLASLTEALAVAVHGVGRSSLRPGDTVVVVGGGPIGVLTAIAARGARAGRVLVVEPANKRRRIAERLGFEVARGLEPLTATRSMIGGSGADVVFDCAGAHELPLLLTELVHPGGTIVIVGIHQVPGSIDLPNVALRELAIVGTRACTAPDMQGALDLLAARPGDFDAFLDDVVPPEQTLSAIDRLEHGEAMKVLIDCRELSGARPGPTL